jgi:hypothetical protein
MTEPALGRLTRVELREVWKNEASNFTPWLAQRENLALLAESMGLGSDGLELQGQEQAVGPFRADILCKNTEDESLVLIENQLEQTDHRHLGQLLTYAAGLKAVTLVWIAERFTAEHRAALDWLNEITDEGCHIFGFEIELWKIGSSQAAPKFNVVVQPNEWVRTVQKASKAGADLTPAARMRFGYWAAFGEHLASIGFALRVPKPSSSNWMNWGLGRSGIHLLAVVNAANVVVGVEVNSRDRPTWFAQLLARRDEVENRVGFDLEWEERPKHKYSIIRCRRDVDMRDESNWPEVHSWLSNHLERLRDAFSPLVTDLDDSPTMETDAP